MTSDKVNDEAMMSKSEKVVLIAGMGVVLCA